MTSVNNGSELMNAVVYQAPNTLEYCQVPVPQVGAGEILVKVKAALTCGTDLKTYKRGHHLMPPPTLFGHEFSGDVVEVGEGVKNFRPGMRVVAHNSAPCGECYWCKHNQHSMCPDAIYNYGAYAEYIKVPAPIVRLNTYEVPDHIPYARAAIMEPLSTVVHGQSQLDIQPGERVAILGAGGPIGLMHLQLAKLRGASQVIAVDMKEFRLQVARELGATHTINLNDTDPIEAIRELTGGVGVDAVIESAGSAETWVNALKVVRKGGRVLWFGGLPKDVQVTLDSYAIHYGELTMYGVFHCTPVDVYHAHQLIMSETINTEKLVSRQMSLAQVEDALKLMAEGKVIKVAILPEME